VYDASIPTMDGCTQVQIYTDLIALAMVFINWSVNIRTPAIHGHRDI